MPAAIGKSTNLVSTVFTVNLHGASNSLHTCMTIVTSVFGRGRLGSVGAGGFCRDCAFGQTARRWRRFRGDHQGMPSKARCCSPADAERRAILIRCGPCATIAEGARGPHSRKDYSWGGSVTRSNRLRHRLLDRMEYIKWVWRLLSRNEDFGQNVFELTAGLTLTA